MRPRAEELRVTRIFGYRRGVAICLLWLCLGAGAVAAPADSLGRVVYAQTVGKANHGPAEIVEKNLDTGKTITLIAQKAFPPKLDDNTGEITVSPDGKYVALKQGIDWERVSKDIEEAVKANRPSPPLDPEDYGTLLWDREKSQFRQVKKGLDAYAELYADSRKWLVNGWVDYFAPQLYWKVDPPIQSFPVLLRWWTEQNTRGRIICPGLASDHVGRAESQGAWPPQEIVNQIRLTRNQPAANGHIHWSMKSLMRNSAFDAVLEREVYAQPALMPAVPWLGRTRLEKPKLTVSSGDAGSQLEIHWTPGGSDKAWLWLLQTRTGREWKREILPAAKTTITWHGVAPEVLAVSAVNRNGQISSPTVLQARNGAR